MEDSFEIKPPEKTSSSDIHFGMTKEQQKEAVRKMKQDNDMKSKH